MITDLEAKRAKPKDRPYMIRDDRGLYLRVDPSARKYWILRYWEARKEHQMSLGPYPDIGLKDARERRDTIQAARARGESPTTRPATRRTFQDMAEEWMRVRMAERTETHLRTIRLRLAKYVLPAIGGRLMGDITAGEVLRVCRRAEGLGHPETARRLKIIVGQVFRYAVAAGEVENDPTVALAGALACPREKHYPMLSKPKEIALLVRAIHTYPYAVLRTAMLFSLYTAARPGEVRRAEWTEIDPESAEWRIPAEKMKIKRPHVVPLSTQATAVLEEMRELSGQGRWLFPSARNDGRCMSENGVRVALRSMGYGKEILVPHGFRSMFSTWANEREENPDVIEAALAHQSKNQVRAAYNRAEYVDQRRKLLQDWADWLEGLSASKEADTDRREV